LQEAASGVFSGAVPFFTTWGDMAERAAQQCFHHIWRAEDALDKFKHDVSKGWELADPEAQLLELNRARDEINKTIAIVKRMQ
jgi:hypothetical protein